MSSLLLTHSCAETLQLFSLCHSFLCLISDLKLHKKGGGGGKINLLLYSTQACAPLFVPSLIATLVCPKYPELGYCILYHVTRQRIKKKRLITYQQMSRLPPKTKRLVRKPN